MNKYGKKLTYTKEEVMLLLVRELNHYEASFSDLTPAEREDLHEWVSAGYSVYDNPLGHADENCRLLCFIEASRAEDYLCDHPETLLI